MPQNRSNSHSGKNTKTPPSGGKAILQQIAKPFSFLILLIMVCSFLAHYLTGEETLEEYAQNNPELAYGNSETDNAAAGTDASYTGESLSDSAGSPSDTADKPLAYDKTEDQTPAENSDGSGSESEPEPVLSEKENDEMNENPNRVTYEQGFYYEPLSEEIKARITGISYPVAESKATETAVPAINMIADDTAPAVSYEDLRYLSVLHYDFNGEVQTGELICNKELAQDFIEIFYELYRNEYRIERIRLVDEYNGDDTASMADNNTSCFNYRVVDGTDSLSKHALGCAIDINPFYNPYVVYNRNNTGETYISPPGSEIYEDRSQNFPYKIDENDLCYKLFKAHGFTWGGDWNSSKDYQHFQKVVN